MAEEIRLMKDQPARNSEADENEEEGAERGLDAEQVESSIDINARFTQSLSYFIEWAKHIITISSAILVLGTTFLREIVSNIPLISFRVATALLLVVAFLALILAIWKALRFISTASSTVFSDAPIIASSDDLVELQWLIQATQRFFLAGIAFFSALAAISLISWAALSQELDSAPGVQVPFHW